MITVLRLLAPYLAVGVFWCSFSNAWLAILAYHAQILVWLLYERPRIGRMSGKRLALLSLPTIVTGALLYLLLPHITRTGLVTWLAAHKLSERSLLIMVPYFGLLHPFLEQLHWSPLRERTLLAHFMFAGYHVLVLYSLLSLPWLVVCFLVLAVASLAWQQMQRHCDSVLVPFVSHALADTGVVIAALLRI